MGEKDKKKDISRFSLAWEQGSGHTGFACVLVTRPTLAGLRGYQKDFSPYTIKTFPL